MRKRKILLNIVLVMIVLLCLASFATILLPDSSSGVIIAIFSLDVALLALYISLRTFYSIDEVNAISRMDGNVMENKILIKEFHDMRLDFVKMAKEEEMKTLKRYTQIMIS
jgi:hypothetical protein